MPLTDTQVRNAKPAVMWLQRVSISKSHAGGGKRW